LNREFVSKGKEIADSGKTVFSIGHNTFFTNDGGKTTVRYTTGKGIAELQLGTIEELAEGSAPFESADDDWALRVTSQRSALKTSIVSRPDRIS
jgi:hypothetical protein